jgi:BCD family chlorophyll transporter-like MFS transporter
MSTIASAVLMNKIRPTYTPEAMQRLYNLTPLIVIGFTLLGLFGIEKRLSRDEMKLHTSRAQHVSPQGNPLIVAWKMLGKDSEARSFFVFIFVAIFAIFLQDNILEVFGAEVLECPSPKLRTFSLLGVVAS